MLARLFPEEMHHAAEHFAMHKLQFIEKFWFSSLYEKTAVYVDY